MPFTPLVGCDTTTLDRSRCLYTHRLQIPRCIGECIGVHCGPQWSCRIPMPGVNGTDHPAAPLIVVKQCNLSFCCCQNFQKLSSWLMGMRLQVIPVDQGCRIGDMVFVQNSATQNAILEANGNIPCGCPASCQCHFSLYQDPSCSSSRSTSSLIRNSSRRQAKLLVYGELITNQG